MKINIIHNQTELKKGEFDEILIEFQYQGQTYKSNIVFDFDSLYSFTQDKDSIAFDLLLLGVLIYNIDQLISRHIHSYEGWTREIEIKNIPVYNVKQFNNIKSNIEKMLSFLSGDNWSLDFIKSKPLKFEPTKQNINVSHTDKVCLFSGGLDSLIGAIDLLENKHNILLVSHFNGWREKDDQNLLFPFLNTHYSNQITHAQIKVGHSNSSPISKEDSLRCRSFLFLTMATYLAHNINSLLPIIVPENGTISLNIPLSPSRRSSCSTRTTHPTFLNEYRNIIKLLGISNEIKNPYEYDTKGEMMISCKNKPLLEKILHLSVSCGKRRFGHGHTKHCGKCMPCIYRRVAFHLYNKTLNKKIHELYQQDITKSEFDIYKKKSKGKDYIDSVRDVRALLNFIKEDWNIKQIKRELIINGLAVDDNLDKYANVVKRSFEQIREWLKEEGNSTIKNFANINDN